MVARFEDRQQSRHPIPAKSPYEQNCNTSQCRKFPFRLSESIY